LADHVLADHWRKILRRGNGQVNEDQGIVVIPIVNWRNIGFRRVAGLPLLTSLIAGSGLTVISATPGHEPD